MSSTTDSSSLVLVQSSLRLGGFPGTLRSTSPRPTRYYHTTSSRGRSQQCWNLRQVREISTCGRVQRAYFDRHTVRHMWCCSSRSVVRKSTWWHSTFASCYARAPVYHHKSYHAGSCTQTRDTGSPPIWLSRRSGTGDSDCAGHARGIARLGPRRGSVPTSTFFPFRTDLARQ